MHKNMEEIFKELTEDKFISVLDFLGENKCDYKLITLLFRGEDLYAVLALKKLNSINMYKIIIEDKSVKLILEEDDSILDELTNLLFKEMDFYEFEELLKM